MALAGFSSLVGVIGSRSGRSHPHIDALRLRVMLQTSLAVALFALVPFIPSKFGASDLVVWRLSASAFLVAEAGLLLVLLRQYRSVADLLEPADRRYEAGFHSVSVVADGLLFWSLFLASAQTIAAFYFTALVVLLAVAGVQFIRFAASTFGSASSG